MPLLILLLLLGGVVLEIWVAIRVGDLIGVLPVILLLIAGPFVGSRVLGRGTVRAWRRVTDASRSGERLGASVLNAGLVVFAGFLLVLPGLVSSALGLLVLLPPVRAILRPLLAGLVARRALPVILSARGAAFAAGRRPGGPADVEGHATDAGPAGEPEGPVRGEVLPAPDDLRRPDDLR